MSGPETSPLSVLISPGQGTHTDNMIELAERFPSVTEAYELADRSIADIYGSRKIDGKNISEWANGETKAQISLDTRIAQPLIVATSIGINEIISNQESFTTAYGNSLGEIAALVTAGSLTKEHAIKLSVIRGLVSYEASKLAPGKMVVIKNATHDLLEQLKLGEHHGVSRAVHFSPSSITLAGTEEAIKQLYDKVSAGYRRTKLGLTKEDTRKLQNAIMMGISGGFHSFLMKPAEKEFSSALDEIDIKQPSSMLWFSNHSGQYEGDPAVVREHLVKQLTHGVELWSHIGKLIMLGHTRFVESGTAPQITNEYRLQQNAGNLPPNADFVFGLEELDKLTT